jgi:hypothetical protein
MFFMYLSSIVHHFSTREAHFGPWKAERAVRVEDGEQPSPPGLPHLRLLVKLLPVPAVQF